MSILDQNPTVYEGQSILLSSVLVLFDTNGSLLTPKYCQWLHYWDALLLVVCKVNKGKVLFVGRHHLVNTLCQLWDSDRAFWLFGVGQTSV